MVELIKNDLKVKDKNGKVEVIRTIIEEYDYGEYTRALAQLNQAIELGQNKQDELKKQKRELQKSKDFIASIEKKYQEQIESERKKRESK